MYAKLNLDWKPADNWQAGLSLGYQDSMEKTELTATQRSLELEASMKTLDVYTSYTFGDQGKLSLSLVGLNNPSKRKTKTVWNLAGSVQQSDWETEQSAREWVLNYNLPF